MSIDVASPTALLGFTVKIVSSYLSHNSVSADELPGTIRDVQRALTALSKPKVEVVAHEPKVPVKKSVTPDFIICLEDGKKFRSLKRHLRSKYNLTPEEYRAKWGLPADYPMVAPNYSVKRSELARTMGLGQMRRAG